MTVLHPAHSESVKPPCLRRERPGSHGSSPLSRRGALAVALLSVLLADCSRSVDKSAHESAGPAKEAGEPPQAGSRGLVKLDTRVQHRLHLKVEPLTAITTSAELKGYGRVLDPTPLASLVTELASAQAAATASGKEFARLQSLQEDNNASIRALQAAEAAATRDRLLVQSARDRLALAWGQTVSQRTDLPALVRALTTQERLIVRIDLPAGERITGPASTARLVGLADETHSTAAEYLSPAPATDPQMQGEGLLYLTRDNSLHLAADAAVTGYLALSGQTLHGVLLPRSAVLRHAGETWVYLQIDETQFRRVPVALTHPAEGGWLISQGLKSGDRAVTDGAQVLLSEELKSQLSLGD
jgi:hypothetical protein